MTCVYTFKNEGEKKIQINVELPFINEPEDLILFKDGEELSFLEWIYDYEFIDNRYVSYIPHNVIELSSIVFHLEIQVGDEVEISVEYTTPISVYEFGESSYWFCYLVGTGRYWSQPIEKARFEVRVPSKMYSYHESEGWKKHMTDTKVVLEKEYENWVPIEDLIILRWRRSDIVLENRELKIALCLGGIGLEIVFIAIVAFYFKRKRNRRMREE